MALFKAQRVNLPTRRKKKKKVVNLPKYKVEDIVTYKDNLLIGYKILNIQGCKITLDRLIEGMPQLAHVKNIRHKTQIMNKMYVNNNLLKQRVTLKDDYANYEKAYNYLYTKYGEEDIELTADNILDIVLQIQGLDILIEPQHINAILSELEDRLDTYEETL